ncbi:PREDICTED: putative protein TPRXL [Nicrophorus vespilloides]|uniref:Uncharacterized protein n=1 Tax=Nicrophorus vespilloides TaxID=110193 RepID=A0ABM1NHP3_NICVS|nr:PREDICTED: putative protein TPRXL [Nicrophorus vespilloides]
MDRYMKLPDMQPPSSPTSPSPSKKGSFRKVIRRMISSSSSSKSSSPTSPTASKSCKFFGTEVLDGSRPSSTKSSPRSYRPNSVDQSFLRPQSQGGIVR